MATNTLHDWASTTQTLADIDLLAGDGYQPGTYLKSDVLNTILRETSIVTKGFIDYICEQSGSATVISKSTAASTVKDMITSVFANQVFDTDNIVNGAVTDAKIAAGVSQSKISGLTTDYVASVAVDGLNIDLKNKSGATMQSFEFPGTPIRFVAESDRARKGAAGAYTFTMTAGKKYIVAMFGEFFEYYGNENHDITMTCLAIAGVDFSYRVDLRSSLSATSQTICHVSGNTLTVYDWQYRERNPRTGDEEMFTGARHIVIFEMV